MKKLAILMDPIERVVWGHDSSVLMLLEAQARGYKNYYLEAHDVGWQAGQAYARATPIELENNGAHRIKKGQAETVPVTFFDLILMRKDPPFNMAYIYLTYWLDHAVKQGVLVVNDPQTLRDNNEKYIITHFPQCCAPTVISSDLAVLTEFHRGHHDIILKPLDGMAGQGIIRIKSDALNLKVILEQMTQGQTLPIMAQRYLSAIEQGDKRVILINGEPLPQMLVRLAAPGETRANLAAGGHFEVQPLTACEESIAAQLTAHLKNRGILFAGIDIIGEYLTEINITSPTGVAEIERAVPTIDSMALLFEAIETRLA